MEPASPPAQSSESAHGALDLEAIAHRFRTAGLKATPQRLAIYSALLTRRDHPSPEALYRAVRVKMPSISLGTIYKTLDALSGAGLVSQVAHAGDTKRYDANLEPHHHLICTECRRIIDIQDDALDALEVPAGLGGFKARQIKVQIHGQCEACWNDDGENTGADGSITKEN